MRTMFGLPKPYQVFTMRQTLIRLQGRQLDSLRQSGYLRQPSSEECLPPGELGLAYLPWPEDLEIDFEPDVAMEHLIENCALVRGEEDPQPGHPAGLRLVNRQPMRRLLLRTAAQFAPPQKLTLVELHARLGLHGSQVAARARATISQEAHYLGHLSVCSCGESGCGQTLTWVEQRLPLFTICVSGASRIQYVALLLEPEENN